MKISKKLAILMLAATTALSMAPMMPTTDAHAAGKVKKLKYTLNPAMKSIKVKWKKKKVSYYVIYRTEFKVKSIYQINPVPISRYKKVKKVSGKKSSWTDKKVKPNHYYDYVIKGYKKCGGKAKLVYNSYRPGATYYQCPGLQQPDLINGGYGENYSNSKDRLYLYVQRTDGVRPAGVVIYRSEKEQSGYKKIKARKVEKGKFEYGSFYADTTVSPGKTYYYKARTYVVKKGRKLYSPYSESLMLPALNFTGKYSVKAMTAAGKVKEFVVRMVSDRYNGELTLKRDPVDEKPVYMTRAGKKDYGNQEVALAAYSKDNKTWMAIPKDGLKVTAGQTVYLKFRFVSGSGFFSAGEGDWSDLDFMYDNTSYAGSAGFGATATRLDLKAGTATAFPDYDN